MGFFLQILAHLALGFIAFLVLATATMEEVYKPDSSLWVLLALGVATPIVPLWIVFRTGLPLLPGWGLFARFWRRLRG